MSVQMFLKLRESLELLNNFDSDESHVEIAVLPPDASELPDEDEGDENEVNANEIIIKNVPGFLEVRSGDSFQPELHKSCSISSTKSRKKLKDINHYG
ncbi:hypothetical protein TNCV_3850791 [Trichonephila clavipes]|nr:hypothetical protein TNCV_3850791 [Trichonephila clavipes]